MISIMRTSTCTASKVNISITRFLSSLMLVVAKPIGTRAATSSAASTSSTTTTTTYKTLQVHVVHRHGDRTPITALENVEYWRQQLVPSSTLERVAENTQILRDKPFVHSASGGNDDQNISPFGKLTQLGLLQMIQVGGTLRQALLNEEEQGDDSLFYTPLFSRSGADNESSLPLLHPSRVRVISTDFQRTIQSVQGLLVGLFPDADNNAAANTIIDIDVRHTEWMIPDPQPRPTQEQHDLEIALSRRPHMLQREKELAPLAHKATTALHPILNVQKAHEVSFGVDGERQTTTSRTVRVQDNNNNDNKKKKENEDDELPVLVEEDSIEVEPLAWNQLAEITKCLAVRDLLPPDLTIEDQEAISAHAAWRWFETLSKSRLAYLAMHKLVQRQVESMLLLVSSQQQGDQNAQQPPPLLTIWSAHDSTLVGLLCAYRLERPPVWPEYASYLVMELVQVSTKNDASSSSASSASENNDDDYLAVRFSLNGQRLRSAWGKDLPNNAEEEPPMDMIPLSVLAERTRTIGATPLSSSSQEMEKNAMLQ